MKKRIQFFSLLVSVLFAVLFVIGCGQSSNPTVSISGGQPSGYSIQGTVSNGQLNANYAVLSGATVVLSGAIEEKVVSDLNGRYIFNNLKPGSYSLMVTKEGYQQVKTTVGFQPDAPDNTVLTEDVPLLDNPVILSVVFDNNISPEAVIVTFNEPMDISTVLAKIEYAGMRAAGVSASGAISMDKSWDADNRVLTLKPRGGFVPGANYRVTISGPSGSYYDIKDKAGNQLYPTNLSNVNLGAQYNGSAPADAPANLKAVSTIDYINCIYGSSNQIGLSWDAVPGATAYNLYCSYNGGPFQICQGGLVNNNAFLDFDDVDNALAEYSRVGSWSYPAEVNGVITWPFIGDKGIDFKVTAVNPSGESGFSSVLNIKDNVKPRISSTYRSSSTGVYVNFSEPLEKTNAENISNYVIAGQTVTKVVFQNNYSGSNYAYAYLTISPGVNSGTVEVSSNIKDLSGNEIDPALNKATF